MNANDFIIETIKKLLELLGIIVTDVVLDIDEKTKTHRFVVSTPESAMLIGEQGTRLLSLNHLMKRIVEKKFPGENIAFMIDVNDYQKKHIEDIRSKAHMLAERARHFKSSVEMDPMSSYERMIVHAEFTSSPDIETGSLGIGKERHVVLKYSETKTVV